MNDHTTAGQVITLTVAQVAQHPENIRDAGRDLTALADSIRAGGIRTPLLVAPVALIDGHEFPAEITHVAIDGNRRVAAARQLGDDIALPCIVRDDLADRRETIRTMAITGLARDGLTTAETVAAVQTMLDLGLTQTAVAKDTGLATKTVRAAKKAAQLTTETAELAAEYELTLDQLATLTDWEDNEEATSDLLAAANTGRWDHTLARLSRDRKNQQAKAQLIADHSTTPPPADAPTATSHSPNSPSSSPAKPSTPPDTAPPSTSTTTAPPPSSTTPAEPTNSHPPQTASTT